MSKVSESLLYISGMVEDLEIALDKELIFGITTGKKYYLMSMDEEVKQTFQTTHEFAKYYERNTKL